MSRVTLAFLSITLLLHLSAQPALAIKPFLERTKKLYDLEKPLASCHLCHAYDEKKGEEADKRNLNDYGHDLANDPRARPLLDVEEEHKFTREELDVLSTILISLDTEDSDKDGASNKEELKLGTWPGDKNSTPSAEALKNYRAAKK
jgi:hypothetical protein